MEVALRSGRRSGTARRDRMSPDPRRLAELESGDVDDSSTDQAPRELPASDGHTCAGHVESGDEDAERMPRGVRKDVQGLVRVIAPVQQQLRSEGLSPLPLPLQLGET